MDFIKFRNAVSKQLELMYKDELFLTNVSKEDIWDTYLKSFPEGTNPIYIERTEHDCNCCKNFIRQVGRVVAIKNGKIITPWDVKLDDDYQVVADALAKVVSSAGITNVYRADFSKIGAEKNYQPLESGSMKEWNHLHTLIPNKIVMKDSGSFLGTTRSDHDVLKRSLEEISDDAIDIVLDMIAENGLYRGEEHKGIVQKLKEIKTKYNKLKNGRQREIFLWSTAVDLGTVGRIRNTVIGTLLVDISEGVDLDKAVTSFESKVAPSNYKRSSAVVTKGMIKEAEKKVQSLGIEESLNRRFANESDLTINNVLFADHNVKVNMAGSSIFDDLLKTETKDKVPSKDKIESVTIDKFMSDILPKVNSIEMMFENRMVNNLMSLIAPVDPDAPNILKWGNNFSWTYNGDVTDSELRQQVKARGGSVDGVFRFSHSWNYDKRNTSLMDLHVFMPGSKPDLGKIHDHYGNQERVGWNHRVHQKSGGIQDVDYTAQAPVGYVPVENITFPDLNKMPDGVYRCRIHNWDLRQPTQAGFRAEIEFDGQVFEYEYAPAMKHKEWVDVADVTLRKGVFTIKHHLPTSISSQEKWGVHTQKFTKVNMLMNSPNHWDGEQTGNKHVFFILDGCENPENARGLYNEFLKNELNPHRKVFEVLGSKLKAAYTNKQLSGVGFSTTKRDKVTLRVKGSYNRVIEVTF